MEIALTCWNKNCGLISLLVYTRAQLIELANKSTCGRVERGMCTLIINITFRQSSKHSPMPSKHTVFKTTGFSLLTWHEPTTNRLNEWFIVKLYVVIFVSLQRRARLVSGQNGTLPAINLKFILFLFCLLYFILSYGCILILISSVYCLLFYQYLFYFAFHSILFHSIWCHYVPHL